MPKPTPDLDLLAIALHKTFKAHKIKGVKRLSTYRKRLNSPHYLHMAMSCLPVVQQYLALKAKMDSKL